MDGDIYTEGARDRDARLLREEVEWRSAQIPDILLHYMVADGDNDADGIALMGSALHSLVDRLSERIRGFLRRRP